MAEEMRFLFIKLEADIFLDFKKGEESLLITPESIEHLLNKTTLNKELRTRVSKLFGWIFVPSRASTHTTLFRSSVSSIYISNAKRLTYHMPPYMMVRYMGPPFPEILIKSSCMVKKVNDEGDVTNILSIKFNEVRLKEISHQNAEDLKVENPSYLIAGTFNEVGKKK
ncbi:putative M protein [Maize associated rhabdovirus]|uniref:Putative M protein n=1 Tax=Maize associated rhabdovirus TaxID=2003308 RepID=A0A1X9Y2V5_9RHAB|nr:putative M protein [Maize associated rhabdovirus]ARS22493.1 putative M protein [Maize associated rhabdovirus]